MCSGGDQSRSCRLLGGADAENKADWEPQEKTEARVGERGECAIERDAEWIVR